MQLDSGWRRGARLPNYGGSVSSDPRQATPEGTNMPPCCSSPQQGILANDGPQGWGQDRHPTSLTPSTASCATIPLWIVERHLA